MQNLVKTRHFIEIDAVLIDLRDTLQTVGDDATSACDTATQRAFVTVNDLRAYRDEYNAQLRACENAHAKRASKVMTVEIENCTKLIAILHANKCVFLVA